MNQVMQQIAVSIPEVQSWGVGSGDCQVTEAFEQFGWEIINYCENILREKWEADGHIEPWINPGDLRSAFGEPDDYS